MQNHSDWIKKNHYLQCILYIHHLLEELPNDFEQLYPKILFEFSCIKKDLEVYFNWNKKLNLIHPTIIFAATIFRCESLKKLIFGIEKFDFEASWNEAHHEKATYGAVVFFSTTLVTLWTWTWRYLDCKISLLKY